MAQAWDGLLLNARQLGYTLLAADRARGLVRISRAYPGRRVRDYTAGTERYTTMAWWALEATLTLRLQPVSIASYGPADGAQSARTAVAVRSELLAEGRLLPLRSGGTSPVTLRVSSNGALEQAFLEALPTAVQVAGRRAAGAAEPAGGASEALH